MIKYTGPLSVASLMSDIQAEQSIILVGLGQDCAKGLDAELIRVRIEMTIEDAEDLIRTISTLIRGQRG